MKSPANRAPKATPLTKKEGAASFVVWRQTKQEVLQSTLKLFKADPSSILSLEKSGRITALISRGDGKKYQTRIFATAKGQLRVDPQLKDSEILGILWNVLALLRSKKRTKHRSKLLANIPPWLDEDFRFDIKVKSEINSYAVRAGDFDLETYRSLLDIATDRTGRIPPAWLVDHLMTRYNQGDWPLMLAALEALLSRVASAEAEELRIGERPDPGAIGLYRVKKPRQSALPYAILISGGTRIEGSCSCPDFSRNTLMFCEHIAAIYNEFFAKAKLREELTRSIRSQRKARLIWSPPLGLNAVEDPLLGLRLLSAGDGRRAAPKDLLDIFHRKSPDTDWQLSDIPPQDPLDRLEFLERIETKIRRSSRLLVDPAAYAMIQREIDRVQWPAAYSARGAAFESSLDALKVKLYPYQREGVLQALRVGRFLLGDDMGLGKTTQGIAWAESLLDADLIKRVLVICPASLKSQWRREWGLVSGRSPAVVDGPPDARRSLYSGQAQVLLINYELVMRDIDEIDVSGFDAVILDEAQRIKNFASKTAQTIKRLRPPFRLVLTGTPMENRLSEFASLMDWVDSHAFGPDWRLNAETSTPSEQGRGYRSVRGLNLIRERVAPYFLRRTRKEVLSQLPDRTDTVLWVDPCEQQLVVHREWAAVVAQLTAIAEKRPLSPEQHLRLMTSLTKMRIVSNGLAQYDFDAIWESIEGKLPSDKSLRDLHSPKLGIFSNLIEELLSQKDVKIVIFSQWRKALRLAHWTIARLLKAQDAEAVFFTGGESQSRRTANIVRFHDDPRVRVFFATDAGGVGLNLQRAASVCINFELPWNPAVLEQRIGRIHRIGQNENIQVYNLVTQNTIEARITELIANKKAVFSALLDEGRDEVVFDQSTSFMNQVKAVAASFSGSEPPPSAEEVLFEPMSSESETPPAEASEDKALGPGVDPPHQTELGSDAPIIVMPEWSQTKEALMALTRSVNIDRTAEGKLRIEADGPAAELLAEFFGNLSTLFKKTGSGGKSLH